MNAVQNVVSNLSFSRIEARTDTDPDLVKFSKHREVDPIRVNSTIAVELIDQRLATVLDILLDKLGSVLCLEDEIDLVPKTIKEINYDSLKEVLKSFKRNIQKYEMCFPDYVTRVPLMISNLQSLIFGRRLLLEQGVPSFKEYFLRYIENVVEDIKQRQKDPAHVGDEVRKELLQKTELREILDAVRLTNLRNGVHPKMLKLHELLTTFFSSEVTQEENSKVIVFTQSRISAKELYDFLTKKSILIKASMFVGQANRFGQKGMTQEEQQEVIQKLKNNELNLIIATSIAEEGLDIGEVDLIVCFDSGLSPIRLVQRMGRTGRQRRGRVILLLMENEYTVYQASVRRYREIMATLQSPPKTLLMFSFNPRMIPDSIVPKLVLKSQGRTQEEIEAEEEENEIDNLIEQIVQKEEKQEKKLILGHRAFLERMCSDTSHKDLSSRQSLPLSEQEREDHESRMIQLVEDKSKQPPPEPPYL